MSSVFKVLGTLSVLSEDLFFFFFFKSVSFSPLFLPVFLFEDLNSKSASSEKRGEHLFSLSCSLVNIWGTATHLSRQRTHLSPHLLDLSYLLRAGVAAPCLMAFFSLHLACSKYLSMFQVNGFLDMSWWGEVSRASH